MKTWRDIRPLARSAGYTLRPTGFGREHVAFPRGTSPENSKAYFTDDVPDMAGTLLEINLKGVQVAR